MRTLFSLLCLFKRRKEPRVGKACAALCGGALLGATAPDAAFVAGESAHPARLVPVSQQHSCRRTGQRASKFSHHLVEKVFRDCLSLPHDFSHILSSGGKTKNNQKQRTENGHSKICHESDCPTNLLTGLPDDDPL